MSAEQKLRHARALVKQASALLVVDSQLLADAGLPERVELWLETAAKLQVAAVALEELEREYAFEDDKTPVYGLRLAT